MNVVELRDIITYTDLTLRSYSGRGMYGARCASIVGDSVLGVLADLIDGWRGHDQIDAGKLAELVRLARTDSMGRDVVVYWPHINMYPDDPVVEDEDAAV